MHPTSTAYSELQQAYDLYNQRLFGGNLPDCLITLQRKSRTMGYFASAQFANREGEVTDEIAINPEYFAVIPLVEILQTLVHEMVHLFQKHFGSPSRKTYHNAEWAAKMEAIGLMASSTGRVGGKKTGQTMSDYVIPGGLFEQVTAELLTTGFTVTWLDRAPPYSGREVEQAAVKDPIASLFITTSEALTAPAASPALAAVLTSREARPRLNKSLRQRYSCPSCRLNAWGKPGLRILCIDCSVPLVGSTNVTQNEIQEDDPENGSGN